MIDPLSIFYLPVPRLAVVISFDSIGYYDGPMPTLHQLTGLMDCSITETFAQKEIAVDPERMVLPEPAASSFLMPIFLIWYLCWRIIRR